jgi:Fatty acid hydroxylase superfamily.
MKHFSAYIIAVLLPSYYSITYYNISPSDCLGFLGGIFIWMVAEYCFHRYAFHNNNLSPRTYELLAYNHAKHHQNPNTDKDLLLPLRLTMPVALFLFVAAWILISLPFATLLLFGMLAGLTFYEFVHYQAHNKFYNVWPFKFLTVRHLRHHFEHENRYFGVTSDIIDRIMGTN